MNNLNNLKTSFILIFSFSIFFFLIQNPYQDLFSNFDQEFWNSYHALVLYSGYEQEFFNDPGHINYYLFSVYLKILNLSNLVIIPTMDELNRSDTFVEQMNFIVFQSRVFGLFINIFLCFFIIKIFNEFRLKNVFLLTLFVISGNGFLTHVSQYRVETLTLSLFLLAFYFLIKLYELNKNIFLYLFLFNSFLILSVINKVQIIFYIPFYLLLIVFLKEYSFNKKNILSILKSSNEKILKTFVSFFIIIILIFFRSEQAHSVVFLTSIFMLYTISLLIIFSNKDLLKIIYINNLTLISSFILIYFITAYVTNGTPEIFWGFFRISKIRGYLGSEQLHQGIDTTLWIRDFIFFSYQNFINTLISFFEINYSNILILILLINLILDIKNKSLIKLSLLLFIYFVLRFITFFRGYQFYYIVYFDWLMILCLGLLLNYTKLYIKNLSILVMIILLSINIYKNLNQENLQKINGGSYSKAEYCTNYQIYNDMGIWTYFSKRIDKKQVVRLCSE